MKKKNEANGHHPEDTKLTCSINVDYLIVDFISGELYIMAGVTGDRGLAKWFANIHDNGYIASFLAENNLLSIAIKYGNLPWCSTQYTPYGSSPFDLPTRELIADNKGLTVNLMLVSDTPRDVIEKSTLLWPSPLADYLLDQVETLANDSFDEFEYILSADNLEKKYTSEELGTRKFDRWYRGFVQNSL